MAAPSDRIAMRARRWLRLATAVLCGAFLVALTLVTVADVIGRYLLSSPLPGAAEYTEILLMAIVFMGLPAVCLDDGHISVDLLTASLKGMAAKVQLNLGRLLVSVVLGLVSWQLWKHGAQLESYNEVTVYLRAPLGPFAKATAVIAGISAIITFVMAVLRLPKSDGGGV
ncbi:TRAP transporter small permease [Nitratireductor aquimarinus]|uniref:TRAP transporter small permease protein n=1 Tax=Nitratireductor aquimarinus TaxID=889300 RepID=A0ABU4AHT0_9HYPH|nr:TRAP transporter small permease [Nitratireductor aquimarinus]MDV6225798.1 TRAP transporter small permease [Nitratireductor aquimarinus]